MPRALGVSLALASLCPLSACSSPDPETVEAGSTSEVTHGLPRLLEVALESGLRFHHISGASGRLYIVEEMGAGAAMEDFDRDGDLDIYLVQGGALPFEDTAGERPRDRVFRNLLVETGRLQFVDTTEEWGLDARGYGMGIAVADVDANGYPDIFLTNFGPDELWLQMDAGVFRPAHQLLPTSDSWSSSASFADVDRDGWPDLYIASYLEFLPELHRPCHSPVSVIDYCGPQSYRPQFDRLLKNQHGHGFVDVSLAAGVSSRSLPALGVVAHDLTEDGWVDLYVANDAEPNVLWINQRDGTFEDEALLRGVALNHQGEKEGSMGIAIGDVDQDGDADLLVTNFDGESNTFYRNEGSGLFSDRTVGSGLGIPSIDRTSFGTGFLYLDDDSRLDLFTVSGGVKLFSESRRATSSSLDQGDQLFVNRGPGRFEEASGTLEGLPPLTSRGAAIGDVDNDGDSDLVVNAMDGDARLYLNQLRSTRWVGFLLVDAGAVVTGAKVALHSGKRVLTAWSRRDGSYASSSDPRVLFRLDTVEGGVRVDVTWPDGSRETWAGLRSGRYHRLAKGNAR